MKRLLLFCMFLGPNMTTLPVPNIPVVHRQEVGDIVREHPYLAFLTVLAFAGIIYLIFRQDADELEYQRIQEVFMRTRNCYVPYHVERSAEFWKKPIQIEG